MLRVCTAVCLIGSATASKKATFCRTQAELAQEISGEDYKAHVAELANEWTKQKRNVDHSEPSCVDMSVASRRVLIVEQTNLYYMQVNAAKPSPMIWFDTCVEEMQAFFGFIIAMGVVRMPEFDDYWSTDPIFRNSWFSSIFSRDRFKQILRYLHCADNSKRPDRNAPGYKLFKVQALIDTLNLSFRNLYTPKQNLSIDESMVGTKCRVSFIQYMPKKPKKFGIKLWTLCEAETGYCLQFQVYTGKTENDSGEVQAEHGLTYRVVFDLMKYYFDKGYVVFLDNFYTSYQLFVDLLSKGTGACGTVRSNNLDIQSSCRAREKWKKERRFFIVLMV